MCCNTTYTEIFIFSVIIFVFNCLSVGLYVTVLNKYRIFSLISPLVINLSLPIYYILFMDSYKMKIIRILTNDIKLLSHLSEMDKANQTYLNIIVALVTNSLLILNLSLENLEYNIFACIYHIILWLMMIYLLKSTGLLRQLIYFQFRYITIKNIEITNHL